MEDGLGCSNDCVQNSLDHTPDGTKDALDDVEQRGDEVADGVGHGNRWEISMFQRELFASRVGGWQDE